ncbi:MAG: hypothetical protein CVT49_16410 [candidate division Zixibacteria bacterium HGW-Zixibacteria-1]|nr:MAG: hypothetical protein CVT49_16410 [candidate division Zixibacteria bacterium HGW-Zixibacteria-1]
MKSPANDMTEFEVLLRKQSDYRWAQYRHLVEFLKSTYSRQTNFFDIHATEHILRVLHNVDMLVPKDLKRKWTVDEIFLFLCSVWLHDIDILEDFDSSESYRHARVLHAERSYKYVISINEVIQLDEKEAKIIASIVMGQTLPDLCELPEKKSIGIGEVISIRPLAALLKLADALDTDYRRMPDIVKTLSGIPNSAEWSFRESIECLEIDSSVWDIIVYSTPKSFEMLEDVRRALSWVNETLDEIRSELRNLRLLYRRVDYVVDDTYLLELDKVTRAAKKQVREGARVIHQMDIGKLCPFTGAVCSKMEETDGSMVFIGMKFPRFSGHGERILLL